ncbi:MAG TPA: TIR domain-containing protein [Ktedonobacteraceae bacterium]|nr:TIR domain-containing protein [Ktedonobacteraceae bacterium]
MREKVNVFVSYAYEDTALLKNLLTHLSTLRRLDGIGLLWCDNDISAGIERQKVIEQRLKNSQIILLLVSPAFMASEHCYSQEMKHAVARHLSGEARVIPVILRPIYWDDAPFGKLQALPIRGKPVTIWRNRDQAFLNITEGVIKAVKEQLAIARNKPSHDIFAVKVQKERMEDAIGNEIHRFDVCLVCAKLSEAETLMDIISLLCHVNFEKAFSRRNSYEYCYTTIRNHKGELLTVHISWQSYGPIKASSHLKAVIEEFNPRFVGMTGVCAGDKRKVKLGDLVIANCAFVYDDTDLLFHEGDRPLTQIDMELYYSNIGRRHLVKVFDEWRQAVKSLRRPISVLPQSQAERKGSLYSADISDFRFLENEALQENDSLPTPYIIPMASVRVVRRDNPFNNMQDLAYPTVAIDMEGASFYSVVAEFPGIHSLVVKGVCDYADQDKNDIYHEYASTVAAAYMLCFLREYATSDMI